MALTGLQKNTDLNGMTGVILPKKDAVSPEVEGCLKVRLDTGREIAAKKANLVVVGAEQQEQLVNAILATVGAGPATGGEGAALPVGPPGGMPGPPPGAP